MDRPGLSDAQSAVSLPYDSPELPTLLKYARGTRCLVVGSYTGAHMHFLLTNGAQFVHGVEPQIWAYRDSKVNLQAHPDSAYHVDHCALIPWASSPLYDTVRIYAGRYDGADATFLSLRPENVSEDWGLASEPTWNVGNWINNLDPPVFDLAVLDCAGAEYGLLPYLEPICSHMVVKFNGYNNVPVPVESFYFHSTCEDLGKGWYLYT